MCLEASVEREILAQALKAIVPTDDNLLSLVQTARTVPLDDMFLQIKTGSCPVFAAKAGSLRKFVTRYAETMPILAELLPGSIWLLWIGSHRYRDQRQASAGASRGARAQEAKARSELKSTREPKSRLG